MACFRNTVIVCAIFKNHLIKYISLNVISNHLQAGLRLVIVVFAVYGTQAQAAADSVEAGSVTTGSETAGALSCDVNDDTDLNNDNNESIANRQKLVGSVNEQLLKSCVITEQEASRRIQTGSAVVIDIRLPAEFNRYRVANSINLPPHVIKSKAYLKEKYLFLIGDKADLVEMGLLCRELKEQGYKRVSFVKNGLEKWKKELVGMDAGSIDEWEFGKIIPREFTSLKSKIKWLVLDANEEGIKNTYSNSIYENMQVVSFNMADAKDLQLVKAFSANNSDKYLHGVLVVTRRGDNYAKYNDYLRSNGIDNIFFMQGGEEKYVEYLVTRQAFLARLKRGPVRQRSCSGA